MPLKTPPEPQPVQQPDPAGEINAAADAVMRDYSYVTGGPNQQLIGSLVEQSKQKATQYKQNRADATNMYGQLTQTVDEGIDVVQKGYQKAITDSNQTALNATGALGSQLQQQTDQRQRIAAQMGMGLQNASTQYESDARLNEAMGNILGSSQNWANLLRSQQMSAQQQGVDTKTALGQSKNMTLLALKQALDAGQGNINSQIAAEQAKTGTTELTPIGQAWMEGLKGKIKGLVNPTVNTGSAKITSGLQAFETDSRLNGLLGKPSEFVNPTTGMTSDSAEANQRDWYQYNVNRLMALYSDAQTEQGVTLPADLVAFAQVFGLPVTPTRSSSLVRQYNPGFTPSYNPRG